jgi:DNA-binding response OmpR family regulator
MRALLVMSKSLVEAARLPLAEEGFTSEAVGDIGQVEDGLSAGDSDVVLLQGRLAAPALLLHWRRGGLRSDVLVLLPACADGLERAGWFDSGADGCVPVPLLAAELRAQVRVLTRRRGGGGNAARRVGDLEIDPDSRVVRRAGQEIALSPGEFRLLWLLARRPGQVVTRATIRASLYDGGSPYSNVVDVYVGYLRDKIDRGFARPLILTRRGQGYLLRGAGD